MGEKISYLFNKPKVGDRIVFKPDNLSSDHIGIITTAENDNNTISYKVASSTGKNPWKITASQISAKIYYPFVKEEEIKQIISKLPTPETTQKVLPTIAPIANSLPQNSPTPIITNPPATTPAATAKPTAILTPVVTSAPAPKTIQVSISGKVYRDEDCNSGMSPSESGISGVEVDIYQNHNTKLAVLTTDANGNYQYSKEINEDETIVLEAHNVAPSGYKIYDDIDYSDVNKSFPNVVINLPRVPYESLGNCSLQ